MNEKPSNQIKVPNNISLDTRKFINIQTKFNLLVAIYGCDIIELHLDSMSIRIQKRDGKLLGAYIENKICQEYKISRYELMESNGRLNLTEARQLMCVFAEKYLKMSRTELSLLFHKSRHFAKRMIGSFDQKLKENHPLDKKLIERFNRLNTLINAYVDFKPIIKNEP